MSTLKYIRDAAGHHHLRAAQMLVETPMHVFRIGPAGPYPVVITVEPDGSLLRLGTQISLTDALDTGAITIANKGEVGDSTIRLRVGFGTPHEARFVGLWQIKDAIADTARIIELFRPDVEMKA